MGLKIMSDEIKETVEETKQVESNETSETEEQKEQDQSSPTLTAFEIEKIVEMKVQEILSKLQKADEVETDEVEVEEDIEF